MQREMSKEIDKDLIEKIKNFLIVVLVFMAILLLYFLWGPESLESFIFNNENNKYVVIEKKELIVPDSIVISRGNGDYHMDVYRNSPLWIDNIVPEISKAASGKPLTVEEITRDQYDEIMEYSSVKTNFGYDIPVATFAELYAPEILPIIDHIGGIKEIGFSEGSKESIFIYDGTKKKYFRIVSSYRSDVSTTLKKIAEDEKFDTYYPLQNYFGENTQNRTLLPVEPPNLLGTVDYGSDMLHVVGSRAAEMAETYFGKSFDFVRKIEEADRTTVYMYGYGQRVLTINPTEGFVEYKQAPDARAGENKSLIEALDIALNFIGKHEDFSDFDNYGLNIALEKIVSVEESKKSGYRFEFGLFFNGNKIYCTTAPIQVEVIGGQISYFRKEYLLPGSAEIVSQTMGQSAVDTIVTNYDYLRKILVAKDSVSKEEAKDITFEDVAANIDSMKTGYLKEPYEQVSVRQQNMGEVDYIGRLHPVWIVGFAGEVLYFDLKTGEPLVLKQ